MNFFQFFPNGSHRNDNSFGNDSNSSFDSNLKISPQREREILDNGISDTVQRQSTLAFYQKALEKSSEIETPFLLLSLSKVEENYFALRKALGNVEIHYAVKANPAIQVISKLKDIGAKFDICSSSEFRSLETIGVNGYQCFYSNPIKREKEIKFALERGVNCFVFDNEFEISKMVETAPGCDLLLRLGVSNYGSQIQLSKKFGVHPDDAIPLIVKAQDAGLRVRGLCFHVGSQCCNPDNFVAALEICSFLFCRADELGIHLDVLNIGGGFPVHYTTEIPLIEEFGRKIRESLEEGFSRDVRVIAEPGRFIVGDAVVLVTKVIGKSVRAGIPWYFLDEGLYGSFSGKLYDLCNYQVWTTKGGEAEESVLAGPTCDSFDVVFEGISLPPLELGDILMVPSMGAYTSASASSFNGIEPAPIICAD